MNDALMVQRTLLPELALPALATALGIWWFAHTAEFFHLLDRGGGIGLHRVPLREGRKLVAGLGISLGLGLTVWQRYEAAFPRSTTVDASMAWLAIFLALGIGLIDDVLGAGLSARWKLLGQALPALAFAAGVPPGAILLGLLAFLGAIVAQNLANTFDNADGALLCVATLALAPARPEWSACLLVALLFNLRQSAPARILLGDGGSHMIALLLLCEPRAWGAFALPALDLARVLWVRRSQARPFWIGDRTHLAHRMQARGLGPLSVAARLALVASPAIAAIALARDPQVWAAGLGATALGFAILVRATPAVDGRGQPLSSARSAPSNEVVDRVR